METKVKSEVSLLGTRRLLETAGYGRPALSVYPLLRSRDSPAIIVLLSSTKYLGNGAFGDAHER